MNYRAVALKSICSLILGLFLSLFYLQYDPAVHSLLGRLIGKGLSYCLCADVKLTVTGFNLFVGRIDCSHAQIISEKKHRWHGKVTDFTAVLSMPRLLKDRFFDISIWACDAQLVSDVEDGKVSFVEHVKESIARLGSVVPAQLRFAKADHAKVSIKGHNDELVFTVDGSGEFKPMPSGTACTLYLSGGHFVWGNRIIAKELGGSVRINVPSLKQTEYEWHLRLQVPELGGDAVHAFMKGEWDGNKGNCACYNSDRSLCLDPINLTRQGEDLLIQGSGEFDIGHLAKLALPAYAHKIRGKLKLQGACNLSDIKKTLCTQIVFENIGYGNFDLDLVSIDLDKHKTETVGRLICQHKQYGTVELDGNFDHKYKTGRLSLHNANLLKGTTKPGWRIDKQALFGLYKIDDQGVGSGNGTCTLVDRREQEHEISCTAGHDKQKIFVKFASGSYRYGVELATQPCLRIARLTVNKQKKELVALDRDEQGSYRGHVEHSFIRRVVEAVSGHDIPGHGVFRVCVTPGTSPRIWATLENGAIRMLRAYNFVRDMDLDISFDQENRRIVLNNLAARFHQGSIECDHAAVWLDDNWKPIFAHMPILMDGCFVSWKKNLFGLVSGYMVLGYGAVDGMNLDASLALDRSLFGMNVLSSQSSSSMVGLALGMLPLALRNAKLNIAMHTTQPTHIKTSFLKTGAALDLQVVGQLESPELLGSINLVGGQLIFPYKALAITKGNINFEPNRTYDPPIELTAQGKAGRFWVTLSLDGSAQNPRVAFESVPALSQEQIVSLLFAGSHEASLNVVMPTLLIKNLGKFLLSSKHSASKFKRYFKALLGPLKHVRLLPSFADQSGRGGLRAALEVEWDERIRAKVQKNFSLQEDVLLELDYLLSDDVSVRGMRNERGDLGGEVEIRWTV
ncbi:hypothetical protein HOL34_02460 [bacterium]|nr:hypothetical protein [bacterium]MBT4577472.1 hypothetical protein [bacterium]MBT5346048.1 hypothetical protein [bacterium]MBT6130960.1 hypothetical protein [bacterium]MBT6528939.1 hypothetical protein [bacterium]